VSPPQTAMDRLPTGLIGRMGAWGFVVLVLATLGAGLVERRLAVGVAIGGAVTLAMFGLHRALAPAMLASPGRRWLRTVFWAIWAVKWPLVGALLYIIFKRGLASPIGVALGVGILPAIATGFALRAFLADIWRGARAL